MVPEKTDRRGTPPGAGTTIGTIASTGQPGGRIGNPPFVPTDEQRQQVRTYAKVMSQDMIASALDISVDTLQRHFRRELDEGKREAVAAVGGKLLAKALAGNIPSMIFYLRTQGKWNTRVEHVGADGGPIQHFDLSGLNEEQKRALLPVLDQLLISAGATDEQGGDADPSQPTG